MNDNLAVEKMQRPELMGEFVDLVDGFGTEHRGLLTAQDLQHYSDAELRQRVDQMRSADFSLVLGEILESEPIRRRKIVRHIAAWAKKHRRMEIPEDCFPPDMPLEELEEELIAIENGRSSQFVIDLVNAHGRQAAPK